MKKAIAEFKNLLESFYGKYAGLSDEITSINLSADKWSLKEIIGHLIDSASNNHQRVVRLQIDEAIQFPGYFHADWLGVGNYNKMSWPELLHFWLVYNKFMLRLFQTVRPACLEHVWERTEGSMTLEALIIDYVRHFREHLQHFEERLQELGSEF